MTFRDKQSYQASGRERLGSELDEIPVEGGTVVCSTKSTGVPGHIRQRDCRMVQRTDHEAESPHEIRRRKGGLMPSERLAETGHHGVEFVLEQSVGE